MLHTDPITQSGGFIDSAQALRELQGSHHEFQWTDSDFQRIRSLIRQKAGIDLREGRQAMVYSRLSRRLRETGHRSFRVYLDDLERNDGQEWQEFINALTTNLTAFFREQHHFDVLAKYLRSGPSSVNWRIWCAAASTGEEAYSIAMTVRETLGDARRYQLLSSDIDTRVLATAKAGMYKLDELKGLSPERMARHFQRGNGSNAGLIRVKSELQKQMEFFQLNLNDDNWVLPEPFDVVFCRNVMIYFDAATQARILQRLHRVLRPGGLLFVGHSENFRDASDLFALQGKTVYARL
ncbi:CheR family methyltransferase [Hydrogenophaga sp.]|uniref:CheR family methyltransferase n=1 Tax=Hydrogenophaga sp. TaxID=1904254 RepID=UPI003567C19D